MTTVTGTRPQNPSVCTPAWLGRGPGHHDRAEPEDLGRALVAGLILEVILDAPGLSEEPRSRRLQVKSRLKNTLVSRLAGHIPLNSFMILAQKLDLWFDTYYPLVTPGDFQPAAGSISICTSPTPTGGRLAEDLLARFLDGLGHLLPQRRHRKLSREGLQEFLRRIGGVWFRLRDFQDFFQLDRKTAWEYVQKLAGAGLFCHNQGRSASVRYRLESRFVQTPDR